MRLSVTFIEKTHLTSTETETGFMRRILTPTYFQRLKVLSVLRPPSWRKARFCGPAVQLVCRIAMSSAGRHVRLTAVNLEACAAVKLT